MAHPTLPHDDLDVLSACCPDPDADLTTALHVLADLVTVGVPSFLGLTVTVIMDGIVVTLTAVDPALRGTAQASLQLALSAGTPCDPDTTVVFYAAHPGAFTDLVAVAESAAHRERVVVDGHLGRLPTARPVGVSGLTESTTHHQAIGVLIGAGHTPAEAIDQLRARADHTGARLQDTVRTVPDGIAGPLISAPANPTAVVPPGQADGALGPAGSPPPGQSRLPERADLSHGERAVLRLLVAGYSTVAIAATLLLSPSAIRTSTQSIMRKLVAGSRVEIVAITLAEDILGPP